MEIQTMANQANHHYAHGFSLGLVWLCNNHNNFSEKKAAQEFSRMIKMCHHHRRLGSILVWRKFWEHVCMYLLGIYIVLYCAMYCIYTCGGGIACMACTHMLVVVVVFFVMSCHSNVILLSYLSPSVTKCPLFGSCYWAREQKMLAGE